MSLIVDIRSIAAWISSAVGVVTVTVAIMHYVPMRPEFERRLGEIEMWTDSAAANGGESTILLKAPVSTYQTHQTASLNYKIWKES